MEINRLIVKICDSLIAALADIGIRAASEPPTYVFDKQKLMARWSHKSIAVLTGLGSFGLHRSVITDSGCAGRFGSLVTDFCFRRTLPDRERCLYFSRGRCGKCVKRCPVKALSRTEEFDRHACYNHLMEINDYFSDLPLTDVCGKCISGLPCSLKSPV